MEDRTHRARESAGRELASRSIRLALAARGSVQGYLSMSRRDREGAPHPVDLHVGLRVRALRRQAGLSLTRLAGRVGVAFQQLQKYEAGANRISASMLFDLARALKVPVASFYEGLGGLGGPCLPGHEMPGKLHTFLASPGGPELLDAFLALPRPAQRHLAGLAQAIATTPTAEEGAPRHAVRLRRARAG